MNFALGILAYGSLIDDPGPEIGPKIRLSLVDVETPFPIEFARSSRSRGGAPTLVPVDTGGARVAAVIHVLQADVTAEQAMDWVWRREVRSYGKKHYRPNPKPGKNSVVIGRLTNFAGVGIVLFTRIAANIVPLDGEELARRAIESAKTESAKTRKDGISYLDNAMRHGIRTPLTIPYMDAILALTKTAHLRSAFQQVSGSAAKDSAKEIESIVTAFCQECVWCR